VRVLNPGPGELYDRLSVLKLKIEFGKQRGVNVDEWENEEYEILQTIVGRDNPKDEELIAQLDAVNRNIWVAIDAQKGFAKLDLTIVEEAKLREIAALGLNVMEQNDIRAKLIGEINALYGIERPEKVPGPSSL
jgi:hypothetical protein